MTPGGPDLHAAVAAFVEDEILPRHRDRVAHVAWRREAAPFLSDLHEVHPRQIFRQEGAPRWTIESSPYVCRPAV